VWESLWDSGGVEPPCARDRPMPKNRSNALPNLLKYAGRVTLGGSRWRRRRFCGRCQALSDESVGGEVGEGKISLRLR
jgi:hypothetical protein